MAHRKFTVFLIPDEDGYQTVIPHYPECATWGKSPNDALENAREAMELLLEVVAENGGDPVPTSVYAPHVVVGEVTVRVPKALIGGEAQLAVDWRR